MLWQLADTTHTTLQVDHAGSRPRTRAMHLIGAGFVLPALCLIAQVSDTFASGRRPASSPPGIDWTALTSLIMLILATGKTRTGAALGNPALTAEGRLTRINALLAGSVLLGWHSTPRSADGGLTPWPGW